MQTAAILAWTLVSECPIPKEVDEILVTGEVAVAAYKTFRDSAVFTNKRLIVRDAQGLTGKKVEVYSLPYSSILMWSSENAGRFLDFNSELELWTRAGHIKVNLSKGLDIRRLDRLISEAMLGSTEVAGTIEMRSVKSAAASAVPEIVEPIPAPPTGELPEAGWMPDPHGAFEFRYWDGSEWTTHVCTAGVVSSDTQRV